MPSVEGNNITNKRKVTIQYDRASKKLKVLMVENTFFTNKRKSSFENNNRASKKIKVLMEDNTSFTNKRKASFENNSRVTKKLKVLMEDYTSFTNKINVSIENNRVSKRIKIVKEEDYVMEKQQVSMEDILPEELMELILVRLDVENLIRCKSVCKSWKSLISHHHFIKAHRDHWFNNNDNTHTRIDQVIVPCYINRTDQDNYIVGSSNGLVCINSFHGNEFIVANPWTREERMVPKHPASKESCWGFGYDPVTNDYKIVFGVKEGDYQTSFQVLSLKSNVWKFIGHVKGTCELGELATLCNGALHWLMVHEGQETASIISFDLTKEVFKEIPQPNDARYNTINVDIHGIDLMLGIKDECLCVHRTTLYDHPKMWIMQKYNVKESWVTLGSNCKRKRECIPYSELYLLRFNLPDIKRSSRDKWFIKNCLKLPDIERSTHDKWFIKNCMCVPTTTIMQSLISPHSSGQYIRGF